MFNILIHYTNDYIIYRKKKFYNIEKYLINLELSELLLRLNSRGNLDNVESNGLGDWSTLTSGNDVTNFNSESWGNVDWNVLMSLFESVVLWNVV